MSVAAEGSQFFLEGFGEGAGAGISYTARQCLPDSLFPPQYWSPHGSRYPAPIKTLLIVLGIVS